MNDIGVSIGMIGGLVFGNIKEALVMGPYLIIPLMLFGGLFLNIESFPEVFKFYVYISVIYI